MKVCVCCNLSSIDKTEFMSFFNSAVYMCRSCSSYFTDDSNIEIKKIYIKDYWHPNKSVNSDEGKIIRIIYKVLNVLGRKFGIDYARALSQYNYLKPFLAGKELLEIGAGKGFSLKFFEKKGFHVVGIEPDKDNVKNINQQLRRGHCICGFVEDVPSSNYDLIMLSHVLEHLVNCRKSLSVLLNMLSPNGLLFVEVPSCGNKTALIQSIKDEPHLCHFTKKGLEQLLSSLHYEILKVDIFNASVYTLKERLRYFIYWILKKNYYHATNEINGDVIRLIVRRKKY